LERQIAQLTAALALGEARLDDVRLEKARPRGLLQGFLVGFVIVGVPIGFALLWVLASIGRMD